MSVRQLREKIASLRRDLARLRRELAKRVRPVPARGIDISNNNGPVDMLKVRGAGYDFVYCKASEGDSFLDRTLIPNVDAAKRVGLKVGGYHFLHPVTLTRAGAEREARNYVSRLRAAGLGSGDLRPVVDVEVRPVTVAYVRWFRRYVKRATGHRALIYTSPGFMPSWGLFVGTGLWVAHYTSLPRPALPSPWRRYRIWQWTPSGNVPGVPGDCDLDRCPNLRKIIAR